MFTSVQYCLALLAVDEKLPGCKAAHDRVVILSIHLELKRA